MIFVIKAEVRDPRARTFAFVAQKTMYGGKRIAEGDEIFVFDSENEGGSGLIARGVVTSARPEPRRPGIERQTPRVSITVRRSASAKRRLGREELKAFTTWHDGRPESELHFKLYRQATNKIAGISDDAASWLRGFFTSVDGRDRSRGSLAAARAAGRSRPARRSAPARTRKPAP